MECSFFNAGDATGCANEYEADATMQAEPFGTFIETLESQAFWQKLIDDGLASRRSLFPRLTLMIVSRITVASPYVTHQ